MGQRVRGWESGWARLGAAFLVLLGAAPTWAQMQVGDDVSMTLTGNVGMGYGGSFSSSTSSTSNLSFNGTSNLSGWY